MIHQRRQKIAIEDGARETLGRALIASSYCFSLWRQHPFTTTVAVAELLAVRVGHRARDGGGVAYRDLDVLSAADAEHL